MILNCFIGGVFLVIVILYLLFEFWELLIEFILFEYFVIEVIVGCGFFLMFMLEYFVSYYGFGNFYMYDYGYDNKIELNDVKDLEMVGLNKIEDMDKKGNVDKLIEEVIIE